MEFIMQKVARMHERRIFNYMVDNCANDRHHLQHYDIGEAKEKQYIEILEIMDDTRMR
jgi:hypothetical protein